MLIGIPKEVKNKEYRVGATPAYVKELVLHKHEVIIETNAGEAIGFTDELYIKAGAKIVKTAKDVYMADMVIKVKEPQASEFPLMHEGLVLFCYLHLAPDPEQTKQLLDKKVVGIAYETVTDEQNRLPLLVPMSEMAGRISVQAGATALQMANGGRGVLIGGVPGVKPGKVVVLGGGVVGTEALRMALGLGGDVTVFDMNLNRLRELNILYAPALKTLYPHKSLIEEEISTADLVIGAVLIPGAEAPKLVTKAMLKKMKKRAVIVDVAIDQGGCFETSRPTTHQDPTYIVDDIVHYCVTNMPGACARTSTEALTNATLPYALKIANLGYRAALLHDKHLLDGLNVAFGKITNEMVANALHHKFVEPKKMLQ
jgi:alanine dehydrogenase